MRRYSIALLLIMAGALVLPSGCESSGTEASETPGAPTKDSYQEWTVNQTKKLGELDVTLYRIVWGDGVLAYDIEFKNPTTSPVDLVSLGTGMKFITYTDKGQQFERALLNMYNDPMPERLYPGVSYRDALRITSNEHLMEPNTKTEDITAGTRVINLVIEADAEYAQPANQAEFSVDVDIK
ncbi:MAG: hypothetical protein ACYC5A_01185 [Thermoleophilia bacterium]